MDFRVGGAAHFFVDDGLKNWIICEGALQERVKVLKEIEAVARKIMGAGSLEGVIVGEDASDVRGVEEGQEAVVLGEPFGVYVDIVIEVDSGEGAGQGGGAYGVAVFGFEDVLLLAQLDKLFF